MMRRTFRIACSPKGASSCRDGFAVVAIDVIRATTTAVTAASLGRECYPVGSLEAAGQMARQWDNPLLAGEINGYKPPGFHMNNSPAELAGIGDISRPLILLSSSGTPLIANALGCDVLYLACFRNAAATADRLVGEGYPKIALLGAGSRGEFREEDQIGCAWIAASLARKGYVPEDTASAGILDRWGDAPAAACLVSKSVDYLKSTQQIEDLLFILDRVNDLRETFTVDASGRVVASSTSRVSRER